MPRGKPGSGPKGQQRLALQRAAKALGENKGERTIGQIGKELTAMRKIVNILGALPADSQTVVLGYIDHNFKGGVKKS